jgi:hypothetical protein
MNSLQMPALTNTHVVFPRATLQQAERQIWEVVLTLVVFFLAVFLILNGTNVLPHHDLSFTTEARSEPNSVSGPAVQTAPGKGLTGYDAGLGLSEAPARSILLNSSLSSETPVSTQLPVNSVVVGTPAGIETIVPAVKDEMLQFDGTDIVWKIRQVELTNLADGRTLVGNALSVPEEQVLQGDITIDQLGVSVLGTGVVGGNDLSDASVSTGKIPAGAANTLLATVSGGGSAAWLSDTFESQANVVAGVGPSATGVPETLGTHNYDVAGKLTDDGCNLRLQASGSTVAGAGTTTLAVTFQSTLGTTLVALPAVAGNYSWSLQGDLQRLTGTTGQLSVTLTRSDGVSSNSSFAFSAFTVADWTTTATVAVSCEASSVINSVSGLESTLLLTFPIL